MSDLLERLKSSLAGRYRVERELGRGGMATVYLARTRVKPHRKVAVKVLHHDLAAALGTERFLREIAIAAQLQHPHILTLIDSGEAGGFLYYVMPLRRGRVAARPASPGRRAADPRGGANPAGDGRRLAYAHAHGVVHRDIKPDNVLLSGRHALVTDFGVAKAVSEATGGTARPPAVWP